MYPFASNPEGFAAGRKYLDSFSGAQKRFGKLRRCDDDMLAVIKKNQTVARARGPKNLRSGARIGFNLESGCRSDPELVRIFGSRQIDEYCSFAPVPLPQLRHRRRESRLSNSAGANHADQPMCRELR